GSAAVGAGRHAGREAQGGGGLVVVEVFGGRGRNQLEADRDSRRRRAEGGRPDVDRRRITRVHVYAGAVDVDVEAVRVFGELRGAVDQDGERLPGLPGGDGELHHSRGLRERRSLVVDGSQRRGRPAGEDRRLQGA